MKQSEMRQAALFLIEEMVLNWCECQTDPDKPAKSCQYCAVYSIVHAANGCSGNKECPVLIEGLEKIKAFAKSEKFGRRKKKTQPGEMV